MSGSWARQPQSKRLRKILFQVHLWTGLGIGLYVVVISLSGTVLIYRSELRQRYDPQPRVVDVSGTRLSEDQLVAAAERRFPDAAIEVWTNPDDPRHAVTMSVRRSGEERLQFLYDPYTGDYLGYALPAGWRFTTWLLDFHDNLLGGGTGRAVNGIGAVLLSVLSVTGAVIWWPGVGGWRRALLVDWRATWRRFNWSLHSAFGLWTVVFIFMWGATGIYLAFPGPFGALVDYVEPFDEEFNPRVGDSVLYWFTALHFGRFGGWATKLVWTVVGLVPPVMFVTGVVMWWNRVIRRRSLAG
ncbi:MAG: PepSY-associated TM helix domain-containing protein [Acidobacteriota bacterium]|nr:PepSY-associated TM helix domain-containing protein [Acidobacteriota bacterium]